MDEMRQHLITQAETGRRLAQRKGKQADSLQAEVAKLRAVAFQLRTHADEFDRLLALYDAANGKIQVRVADDPLTQAPSVKGVPTSDAADFGGLPG